MAKRNYENYISAFDEINNMVAMKPMMKLKDIDDEIEALLIISFLDGREAVGQDTGYELDAPDPADILESINKPIDGETFRERIADIIEKAAETEADKATVDGLVKIAQTEFHRVYNEGSEKAAIEIEQTTGYAIEKTWVTVKDDKVRENHAVLEGVTIPLSEQFVSPDGDKASVPGGFEKAKNNINCRCVCEYHFA